MPFWFTQPPPILSCQLNKRILLAKFIFLYFHIFFLLASFNVLFRWFVQSKESAIQKLGFYYNFQPVLNILSLDGDLQYPWITKKNIERFLWIRHKEKLFNPTPRYPSKVIRFWYQVLEGNLVISNYSLVHPYFRLTIKILMSDEL